MKILLIHYKMPYPVRSGVDKTINSLIKILRTAHEVSLMVPVFPDTDPQAVEHTRALCDHLITVPVRAPAQGRLARRGNYFRTLFLGVFARIPWLVSMNWFPEFARAVEAHCRSNSYDVVQAFHIVTYGYLRYVKGPACRILGPMNDWVEWVRLDLQFTSSWRRKLATALELRAYQYYQTRAWRRCDWVLLYSDRDLQRARAKLPFLSHARHLPLPTENEIIDRQEVVESFPQQEENSILFVGGLGSFTNQDAVLYFYTEIFPKIVAEVPQAKFYIAGNNPPARIQSLGQNPQVVVTGGLARDELIRLIKKAAVFVAPVRTGSGIKTKNYEAMSLGKAIVATTIDLEGMWDLGEGVFQIHDDPEGFAGAVVSLLQNKARRSQLGLRARDLFERTYTYEAVLPKTLAVYQEIEAGLGKKL